MAFDLTLWKSKLAEDLRGWKARMARAGVNSAYAFVSASALLPVLAAAQMGDWSALMALGMLTANVGTNLLANRIQQWKDEADAARQLEQAVQDDAALRAELDAVLEKLDALTLAREALSPPDRLWFVQTLRDELSRLGNLKTFETVVVGDYNLVVQGEGNTVTYIVQSPPSPEVLAAAQDKARRAYLTGLLRQCESLPLAALGEEEGVEAGLRLDDVYIDLDTTTPVPLTEAERKQREQRPAMGREMDTRSLTTLEAAQQFPRLVLLGDPGAGKSTFVYRLLARLAAHQLGQPDMLLPGLPGDLLPVLIVLRDIAPRVAVLELDGLPLVRQREVLVEAVRDEAIAGLARLDAAEFDSGLRDALMGGKCWLVFDGLDEVPHELRGRVRQAVAAVISRFDLQRLTVTCRVRSYTGEARLPNFTDHTLAPFDQDKIRKFVAGWYTAQKALGRVNAEEAQRKAADLVQAALNPDLRELAQNPMLLTTMALIHQRDIGLPSQRVQLYALAVDVLLRRWQKGKTGALADFLKDSLRLRAVMERLAYEAHQLGQSDRQAADLPRGLALTLLEAPEYLGSAALAAEFLDYVDQRAGLLVGRGGDPGRPLTYSFPHRTFQEYLAGCYLLRGRDPARAFLARAAEGDYWAVAARLAAEELRYNNQLGLHHLMDLAYRLCPASEPTTVTARRAVVWAGGMAALAGRAEIERDGESLEGGPAYLDRLLARLTVLLKSDLPATERAEAGRALARLDDPRAEVMTLDAMPFCFVPTGSFQMGEGDEQHEVALPDFYISQHLVTNAQFAVFVQAGGYGEALYWPEAEAADIWQAGRVKAWNDDVPRVGPYDFGEPFNFPNHPVVGVTWYEALAFTRWLAEAWHSRRLLDARWEVSLPSEAEWEKAARGGLQTVARTVVGPAKSIGAHNRVELPPNPWPRRAYPWGDEFDPDKANIDETRIGTTSAVGCFLDGASPYGAQDMSGNVWEWTRSLYDDKRENLDAPPNVARVVRGGAFDDGALYARCAFRRWSPPFNRYRYRGFRVVASPFRP